jgi:hypothetical protein
MPTRTHPTGSLLLVTFDRSGQETEFATAIDGTRAAATAITMIASRLTLQPGDTLTCRRADDETPPDLPAASRASHFS